LYEQIGASPAVTLPQMSKLQFFRHNMLQVKEIEVCSSVAKNEQTIREITDKMTDAFSRLPWKRAAIPG
jgi:hypothetical protein